MELSPSFPLKTSVRELVVPGSETGSFAISWQPKGRYNMRSKVVARTNIGTYEIQVRGSGAFPQFVLRNNYLDFGTCAVDFEYKQSFTVVNTGKSILSWSVPAITECFTCIPDSSLLVPLQKQDVIVVFKP